MARPSFVSSAIDALNREESSGDVRTRAQRALESSPVFGLRMLTVERVGESLEISGAVASFYHKQLAQEIVLAIAGDATVVNQVRVEPTGEESGYPVRQQARN